MTVKKNYMMTVQERRARKFSDSFKQAKVAEIKSGKTTVNEVCKEYEVSSTNVYRWLYKFGNVKKRVNTIVEADSDTKKLLELKQKVAELEQMIGQKQIVIDFQNKMFELAQEEYGIDFKKKFSTQP